MSLDGTEEQEQHDFSKRALAPVLGDGDDNDGNNEDIGSEDEEMVDELADDDIMDFGVDAQAVPEDDVTRREDLGAGGAEWSNDGMGNSAIHEETHPGGSPVRRESITSNGPVYDLPLDALPHEALDIVHGNAADHSEVPNPLDDLPLEAMLFRNALETQDPFCVIVASNFALLPFSVPQKCAYMLVGFFVVVKFEQAQLA
ncbi:hypothetical protein K439DRAFT_1158219 [Ramaria rubella]|nr:hypothetical protein K439DRAFT_1158219 [Ramaria rubella]